MTTIEPETKYNKLVRKSLWTRSNILALLYGLLNIFSASGIVFANKFVFANCDYHFTYALTWIHTIFTLLGMRLCVSSGLFQTKAIPYMKIFPLAAAYVSYIVLCNLSLKVNTVSFYQVMKIAVAPTVLVLEFFMFHKVPPRRIIAAVLVVCIGIAVCTLNDDRIIKNIYGVILGIGATIMTALYQIWAGSKQKELQAGSMQLLYEYTPQAALMLGILVPLCEDMGWRERGQDTLLGYHYTSMSIIAILISAALGLLVSLSTFLVIGATSSLTYNVVGHLKTIIILSGGCLLFGDDMPAKKLVGICIAMVGILWYTQLKLEGTSDSTQPRESDGIEAGHGSSVESRTFSLDALPSKSAFNVPVRRVSPSVSSKQ